MSLLNKQDRRKVYPEGIPLDTADNYVIIGGQEKKQMICPLLEA